MCRIPPINEIYNFSYFIILVIFITQGSIYVKIILYVAKVGVTHETSSTSGTVGNSSSALLKLPGITALCLLRDSELDDVQADASYVMPLL